MFIVNLWEILFVFALWTIFILVIGIKLGAEKQREFTKEYFKNKGRNK